MKELSSFWQEWTTPYSLKLIENGFFIGILAGIAEGSVIYLLMYSIGMFDTVLIYGK